jgi:activator of HSP90 ATPase
MPDVSVCGTYVRLEDKAGIRPAETKGHPMLIHQESIIAAAPQAVYEVLTDGQKFAAATGMPAQLSDRVGEAFSLFGGRVEGRQIELVPGQRIVQAWRFGATHPSEWDAGVYSVVRFTLSSQQDGTRFIIDHAGVPPEWHDHISTGYPSFYQQRWSATSPP